MDWAEDILLAGQARDESRDRIAVNVASAEALLREIETLYAQGRGYTVATLNLDHVVKMRADPVFRRAYARHSHITADGNPIVWLSRLAGQRIALVPGSDLLDPLCALAARLGMRVAFFGSAQTVLERAAERLMQRHPGLRVVHVASPAMGFDPTGPDALAAREALIAARADLVVLALSAPRQEIFATFAAEAMPGTGFTSIGASLDFVAGHQRRAPRIFRALALEWLWRLMLSPGRLARRYTACFWLLPGLTVRAVLARRNGGKDRMP